MAPAGAQAQRDVSGRADLERDVGVRPVAAVARALAPRVDVRAAPGEGVERLAAEAGRLERDPQGGVEQVVLARHDVAGRQLEAATVGTHDRTRAVGEERHEREPRHLGRRHRFVDELEVHALAPALGGNPRTEGLANRRKSRGVRTEAKEADGRAEPRVETPEKAERKATSGTYDTDEPKIKRKYRAQEIPKYLGPCFRYKPPGGDV